MTLRRLGLLTSLLAVTATTVAYAGASAAAAPTQIKPGRLTTRPTTIRSSAQPGRCIAHRLTAQASPVPGASFSKVFSPTPLGRHGSRAGGCNTLDKISPPRSAVAAAAARFRALRRSFTPSVTQAETHRGSISGLVKNRSGKPRANICVEIEPQATGPGAITDSRGRYTIRGIAPGQHRLLFSTTNCQDGVVEANYAPQWWRNSRTSTHANMIRVRAGAHLTGKNAVLGVGATVNGVVRFKSRSGHPIARACVFATGIGAMRGVFTFTSSRRHGRFRLRGLGTGQFRFDVDPACSRPNPGKLSMHETVHLTAGKTTAVTAVIPPAAQIHGVVTGPDHKPIGG
ncbi:MAG TPA: carboxypeptidase-like regulatory domain-containing protein, partial [Streptosporangiaceae bacterium]